MQAAVELAGSVTTHLSRYETDAADDLIDSEHGDMLPEQLRDTLTTLVDNLRAYITDLIRHSPWYDFRQRTP